MEDVLYRLMDWGAMEALTFSEDDDPHSWLAGRVTEFGVLYNTYQPTAVEAILKLEKTGKEYPMTQMETGHFSVLLQGKKVLTYTLLLTYDNGDQVEIHDPYSFAPVWKTKELERFSAGVHYEVYEKMGAHKMIVDGIEGVLFSVWAPNAMRVSVVGDFNLWDGRRHPMRRLFESGVFELFIPGLAVGLIYKYEIKTAGGLTFLKTDPYGNQAELRPNTASVICDLKEYDWKDLSWMTERKKQDLKRQPMSVYEVHLGSWKKPKEENGSFYNYREIAPMLASYVTDMGYTHIELMPISEHPFDGSWGYQVTGYYAVTSRYGTPSDFMYFVDYMHQQGIGVILDWVPAHFPRDTFALSNFDGTCLYEHADPRQGSHPHWGTLIYNFGRPQVSNFLIANALFWTEVFHIDGLRMDAVASMLYLDYGKNHGEWVANRFGGNENLEAMELLKHLNSVFHKKKTGAILIAEESTSWPMVTSEVDKGGLGFDFKWNMGWMNDFCNYIKQDPLFRKGCHGALTFSMVYAYSENFILVFSHDEVVHGKCSMINKMPGELTEKFGNLRVAYGFMMAHPGKKLLFMGQEFAQYQEWSEERSLDWDLLEKKENKEMQTYTKALNQFYKAHPALYDLDFDPAGFLWISCMDADRSIVSFQRSSSKKGEQLIFLFNFTPVHYKDFLLGVPEAGKYKEVLNSDAVAFGGKGLVNVRAKQSKPVPVDGWDDSVTIQLAPFGMAVFQLVSGSKKAEKSPVQKEESKASLSTRTPKGKSTKIRTEAKSKVKVVVEKTKEREKKNKEK